MVGGKDDIVDGDADHAGAVARDMENGPAACDAVAVAEAAVGFEVLEVVLLGLVDVDQVCHRGGLHAGAAEEDGDVAGGDDEPLAKALEDAGVELVDGNGEPHVAEAPCPAEVVDVGVADDDLAEVLQAGLHAELGADEVHAGVELVVREVGAAVEEEGVVGVVDQVEVVEVAREALDGQQVDAGAALSANLGGADGLAFGVGLVVADGCHLMPLLRCRRRRRRGCARLPTA